MEEDSLLTFLASLPALQSAIQLDGRGDGARIKLDVPATEIAAVMALADLCAGRVFRVVIVEADE